jgi:hypothetical protein
VRHEEDCARCEEEIHEMRRKESRQQEQVYGIPVGYYWNDNLLQSEKAT